MLSVHRFHRQKGGGLSLSKETCKSISTGGFECVADLCQDSALVAQKLEQPEEIFGH
jgi:hypothetical protein